MYNPNVSIVPDGENFAGENEKHVAKSSEKQL